MSERNSHLLTPALVAGAIGGVLSGVPFVNCLCCLWLIGAGILAAYLMAKDAPAPPTSGDGALVGAFTGVVAAVAVSLLSIPLAALNAAFFRRFLERMAEYVKEMPSGWEQMFAQGAGGFSFFWFFLGLIINAAVFAALAALGGIIGITLFAHRGRTPGASTGPLQQPPSGSQP